MLVFVVDEFEIVVIVAVVLVSESVVVEVVTVIVVEVITVLVSVAVLDAATVVCPTPNINIVTALKKPKKKPFKIKKRNNKKPCMSVIQVH